MTLYVPLNYFLSHLEIVFQVATPCFIFYLKFAFRINPLSLVEIIAHVVKQFTNKKDAIAFLEKMEAKVKANDEALALCKVI